MKNRQPQSRTGLLPVGIAIAAALAMVLPGTSASASPAPPADGETAPQLSIAVDNGHTTAAVGDTLTYTISVRNLGTTPLTALVVTQTVPTGLTFDSADAAGLLDDRAVTWSLDLGGSASATLQSTMTVGQTPDELLRLATVACASVSAATAPIVCASHSDQLPAGAAAESSDTSSTGRGLLYVAVVGGFLALGAAVTVASARRHRSRRPVVG